MFKGQVDGEQISYRTFKCVALTSPEWRKYHFWSQGQVGEQKVRQYAAAVLIDLIVWSFSLNIGDRQPRKWKSNWVLKVWKTLSVSHCYSIRGFNVRTSQKKVGDVGGRESDWGGLCSGRGLKWRKGNQIKSNAISFRNEDIKFKKCCRGTAKIFFRHCWHQRWHQIEVKRYHFIWSKPHNRSGLELISGIRSPVLTHA